MKSRVSEDRGMRIIQAFGGYEFVGYEWRDVPEGCESEAEAHPFLDVASGTSATPAFHASQAAEDDEEPEPEEGVFVEEPEVEDLEEMTVPVLRELAAKADFQGYRTMKKADLVAGLKDADLAE